MSYTHLTYPCRKARRPRKGEGSVACQEQGAERQNFLAAQRQRKVYMVKARLLEVQSRGLESRRQRREVETLHRAVSGITLVEPETKEQMGVHRPFASLPLGAPPIRWRSDEWTT